MTQKYPGGFVTLTPPTQNPALGAATQGIWTLDQALTAAKLRSWPMYDPYYKNVVLNLHGNGTNGAQNNTFLDSSTNNFTITRNGNTTQGTFSPYGQGWSNYFDGTSDYIYTASNAVLILSSGSWTLEAFVYLNGGSGYRTVMSKRTGATAEYEFGVDSSGYMYFYTGASVYATTTLVPTSSWVHLAITYDGTNLRMFQNGMLTKTQAGVTAGSGSGNLGVAVEAGTGTQRWPGYISNARVIQGTAVYTSSFTPPTAPLTAITNTAFLTCQSNRFVDNSGNNLPITISGAPSVQRFQPFLFNTSYTPSTIGGSGYFDGVGDYLNIPDNAAFAFGTGSLTIEAWIKTTVKVDYQNIVGAYLSDAWYLHTNAAGTMTWGLTAGAPQTGTKQICDGAWHHVALVRNGSSATTLYVDGVVDSTASIAANINYGADIRIGSLATGAERYFTGYISDVRINKGTAVYTSAFTPPTAPLTAVSGTSLLTTMTNAGIVDNAMMNNLETVGNAQISTSVKKYGTGSLKLTASGDYCKGSPSVLQDIAGGDFTIEFWVNFDSLSADRALVSKYGNSAENAGGLGYVLQWVQSTSVLRLVLGIGGGSDALYTWSWTPSTGTWYHVAVTRSGTSGRAFINGVQIGTTSTVTLADIVSPNSIQIGKTHTTAQYTYGYLDDLRITKGVARYVANFTPPTSQLQDQ